MRDGQARREIASLRADVNFLRNDSHEQLRRIRELEHALEVLGMKHVIGLPAQWVKVCKRAEGGR